MQFWYLTLVVDGRVMLTSIQGEDHRDAVTQAYGVFGHQLGAKTAWAMSEAYKMFRETIDVWEIENVEGVTVKATLIKS